MRRTLPALFLVLATVGCSQRIDSEPRDNIDTSLRARCAASSACTVTTETSPNILPETRGTMNR